MTIMSHKKPVLALRGCCDTKRASYNIVNVREISFLLCCRELSILTLASLSPHTVCDVLASVNRLN